MDLEAKTYAAACPTCSGARMVELLPSMAASLPKTPTGILSMRCEACLDALTRSSRAARSVADAESLRDRWDSICPEEFRTVEEGGSTDENRLAAGGYQDTAKNALSFGEVLGTREPILYLVGQPGSRKTRLAWRMVRAAFDVAPGSWGTFFTSWSWQTEASDSAGAFRAGAWMRDLVACPLVVIDDIAKTEWNNTAAAAFFEMLDQRTVAKRRTVITSNLTAAQFKDWMETGRSDVLKRSVDAIARRMREMGKVVVCLP